MIHKNERLVDAYEIGVSLPAHFAGSRIRYQPGKTIGMWKVDSYTTVNYGQQRNNLEDSIGIFQRNLLW